MDIKTLKLSYGKVQVNGVILEKLGFKRINNSSIWESPIIQLNIRYDGKSYYSKENVLINGQIDKRIDINTIEDLIALYVKLSAEDVLCKLMWCNI